MSDMNFKLWMENDDLDALLRRAEAEVLPNPTVQQELKTTGVITIRTLRSLGISEPDANYLSRVLTKKYGNQQTFYAHRVANQPQTEDEYLYHVALRRNLHSIKRSGLVPGSKPTMSNYADYSKGKVFLTELGGVPYWKERVSVHEEANYDDPKGVVVVRVRKTNVTGLADDSIGTQDSRTPSYFLKTPIAASEIEVVG